jgi:hypothetical protein
MDTRRARRSLTRCPDCGSRLIYPTRARAVPGGTLVSRRCPECERRDVYLASADDADAWVRRQLHLWVELHCALAAHCFDNV